MIRPDLRTAVDRYGATLIRSKYAEILLGGVIVGTKRLECALCGWTTVARGYSPEQRRQLRSHQSGRGGCRHSSVQVFISKLSKEDRSLLRQAFGDFSLRWLLAGNEGLWRADLERARTA